MLISLLYNYYTVKVSKIIFLISVSNLLLFYLSKSNIFNLTNVLSILTTVATAAVAAATFAVTEMYKVIITYIKLGFLSLFIIFFYFSELSLYFLVIFILELPN